MFTHYASQAWKSGATQFCVISCFPDHEIHDNLACRNVADKLWVATYTTLEPRNITSNCSIPEGVGLNKNTLLYLYPAIDHLPSSLVTPVFSPLRNRWLILLQDDVQKQGLILLTSHDFFLLLSRWIGWLERLTEPCTLA